MNTAPYKRPALVASALLMISLAVFKGYLPYVGERLTPRQPPAIIIAMDDAYLVGMGRKTKLWSLKARRVEIGRDRSITTLTGVTDGRLFDQGKTVLQVRAGRAVCDEKREKLELSRGLSAVGSENQRLDARGASWNAKTALLRSKGRVRLRNNWADATADEMTVDIRRKEVLMRNVVLKVDLRKAEGEVR